MDVVNHYKEKSVSQRSSFTNLCRSPWCKQPLSDEGYKNKVPIPAPELSESWLWSDVWAFGKYESATKATQSSSNACTPMRTPNFSQSRQQMTIKWTNQKAGLPLTSDWIKKVTWDFHTITKAWFSFVFSWQHCNFQMFPFSGLFIFTVVTVGEQPIASLHEVGRPEVSWLTAWLCGQSDLLNSELIISPDSFRFQVSLNPMKQWMT